MIKKGKRALGIVTAAALSISFALPVLAAGNAENTEKKPAVSAEEETKEEQVKIYWDSEKGTEDGDGSDRDHAVKDLKKAVKLLKEAKEKAEENSEEETSEEVKESSLENAPEKEAVLLVICSDKELTQEESDYLAKEKAAYITLADLEKQEEEKQAESSKEEEASKEEEDSQEEISEESEEKPDTEETQDSQEQTEESTEEANEETTDEIPEDTSSISTIISAKDNSSTEADSVETKLNLFMKPMQLATPTETSLIQEEAEETEDSQEQTEESSSEAEENSTQTEENQQEEPSQEETTEEAEEEEIMAISLEEPVALQAPVNTSTSLMRALPGRDLVGTGTVNRKNSASSSAVANVVSQQQTTANSSITPAPVKTGDEDYYYLPLMICLTFGVGALVVAEKMSIDKERAKLDNKYSRERTEFSESCDRDEKTL